MVEFGRRTGNKEANRQGSREFREEGVRRLGCGINSADGGLRAMCDGAELSG